MPVRPDKDRLMGTEEAMAKGIVELLEPSEVKSKTLSDLDDEEIGVLTLLDTIASNLDIKELKDFVRLFCQFRVSRFRMGRRELGGIITFTGLGVEESRKKRSIKSLFSGIR